MRYLPIAFLFLSSCALLLNPAVDEAGLEILKDGIQVVEPIIEKDLEKPIAPATTVQPIKK
jgi:hypothetical protein